MRILFIHEVDYPSKVAFEMHEFPELLALRGHDVTFFHFPERAGRRSAMTVREQIAGRVYQDARVTLVTPPTWGGGTLERYLAPIVDLPALRREIRRGGYDAIVLYAVPTTGWQTVALARRAGVPVMFRALDVSHRIRSNLVSHLIRRAEQSVYRKADLLSANTPAMAEYCVGMSGRVGPARVNLPPVDLSHFQRDESEDALRATYGLDPRDEVVLYMGTFFRFGGLEQVIDSLAALAPARPHLRLVLVGGGEAEPELRAAVRRHDLGDRVVFTGVIPYVQLPAHLKMADVAINPFERELLTDVALPHKVLQYMAVGVPAVSTSLRGLRGVLGEAAGVTWADRPEDVLSAALAVVDATPAARDEIVRVQRSTVRRLFDLGTVADAFEDAIASMRAH